jgi:hypothetical protein
MTFDDEPEWMKKARQAPLHSTWESRQPPVHIPREIPVTALESHIMSN